MSDKIKLRLATIEDADFLFDLFNDKLTRENSRNPRKIKPSAHMSWLKNNLKNENSRLYIAEENGVSYGQVWDDYEAGVSELAWSVASDARRHGVGKTMVADVAKRICGPIIAEIKVHNKASIKIAEHVGMEKISEKDGYFNYQRLAIEPKA